MAYALACKQVNTSLVTPVIPSYSVASGPGLGPTLLYNTSTYFIVQFYDALGNLAHPSQLQFNLTWRYNMRELFVGVFMVNYTAASVGNDFQIGIQVNGQDISGSPFHISVLELPSPNVCAVWGDPHYSTYANYTDLQTFSEYVLARDDYVGYQIQTRQEPCGQGTTTTAMAVKYNNTRLEIYSSPSNSLFFVNDQLTLLPWTLGPFSLTFIFGGGTFILEIQDVMKINIRFYGMNQMDLILAMNYTAFSSGVCNSQIIPVAKNESLFNYSLRSTTWETQNPTNYTPSINITADSNLIASATHMCTSLFGSGEIATCAALKSPFHFNQTCLTDAARVGALSGGESAVITYTRLVQLYNCTLNVSNLPIMGTMSKIVIPSGQPITVGLPATLYVDARNALNLPIAGNPGDILVSSPQNPALSFHVTYNTTQAAFQISFVPDQAYSTLVIEVTNSFGVPVLLSPLDIYVAADPCTIRNGNCDFHVTCNFSSQGIACGNCPNGTYSNGTACLSHCGDQHCDANYGETCVTCPTDCGTTASCGICGDGTCDPSLREDCHGCFKDCGPCDTTPTCQKNCNGHGTCTVGDLCKCKDKWIGPTCGVKSVASPNVTLNETTPIVNITVGSESGGQTTRFVISIKSISEMHGADILRTIDMSSVNFTLATVNSGLNIISNYSAKLENLAMVNVIVWQFGEKSTDITFAGTTTSYAAKTLKLSVTIQNWPFYALANSLAIVMDSGGSSGNQNACVSDKTDESGSLQWVLFVINDLSLYGEFEAKAEVDYRIQTVTYTLDKANNTITATLPHFWEIADMDPHFSVLIGDTTATDQCGNIIKKGNSNKKIIEIVVPIVVGLVLLVALAVVFYPRIKLYFKLRRQRIPSSDPAMSQSVEMEIEKRGDMEVNTASGRYVLQL
eukprot:Phypoly_transcript_02382.p1 GENE.Phypoly_transcript_02382~~Phypoly_transcript_02382.p1  ORF type:complete len:938 (+),score=119.17 Phypoly_transcript_02382:92-2815(+)